jgi:hypothetical protein
MLDIEVKIKLKNAELQAKDEKLRMWNAFKPPVTDSKPIHDQKFTGKVGLHLLSVFIIIHVTVTKLVHVNVFIGGGSGER